MPPQRTSNQPIIPHFEDNESLFRRYLQSHFQGGELDPSAIRFDEPPSFLRSAFSEPEDALHTDCADGKNVSGFGVLVMKASAAHYQERTVDNWVFTFQPMHRPLPACYAHSEIDCLESSGNSTSQHVNPPKRIRNAFRLRIARALSVAIPAP